MQKKVSKIMAARGEGTCQPGRGTREIRGHTFFPLGKNHGSGSEESLEVGEMEYLLKMGRWKP